MTARNHDVAVAGYYTPIANSTPRMFYFLERILNVQHIWHEQDFIFRKDLLTGQVEKYLPDNKNRFISAKTGQISMVQVDDPLAGEVIHADNQIGSQVLKRVSPWLVFGQLILAALWILLMISSIIFGSIWLIRFWMGKISGGSNIWVRLWPLIASVLFLIMVFVFIKGATIPFEFGKVSFITISLMILTICFALASAWSVFYLITERRAIMNRIIYWHSAILSGLHLIVTCYLLWYGVIGLQTWR